MMCRLEDSRGMRERKSFNTLIRWVTYRCADSAKLQEHPRVVGLREKTSSEGDVELEMRQRCITGIGDILVSG